MPRYIEQLTENITPATGDWLWIVDVSAEATDQDRKLSVGKLALATGISGGQTINGGTAANDDLTLEGTSHGTKTTSYVILQPTSGNVSIGTPTPASGYMLHVAGKINATLRYAIGGQDVFALESSSVKLGDLSGGNSVSLRANNTDYVFLTTGGNVLIGTETDVTSARLQVGGTTGALLVSRLTTTQRGALTPTNGMILYNSSTNKFQGYEAGAWVNLI